MSAGDGVKKNTGCFCLGFRNMEREIGKTFQESSKQETQLKLLLMAKSISFVRPQVIKAKEEAFMAWSYQIMVLSLTTFTSRMEDGEIEQRSDDVVSGDKGKAILTQPHSLRDGDSRPHKAFQNYFFASLVRSESGRKSLLSWTAATSRSGRRPSTSLSASTTSPQRAPKPLLASISPSTTPLVGTRFRRRSACAPLTSCRSSSGSTTVPPGPSGAAACHA
ncbi:hypothetical protein JHK87_052616 [Glycine soja]|nr:hypothetical protein JHK87_052616 [Glycine soja]